MIESETAIQNGCFFRRAKLRTSLLAAAIALGIAAAGTADAQWVITYKPNPVPVPGTRVTFTATYTNGQPPAPIAGFQWQYRLPSKTCAAQNAWQNFTQGIGVTADDMQAFPGVYQYQCAITYGPGSGVPGGPPPPPPPAPVTVQTTVNIPAPNAVTVISGTTPHDDGTYLALVYQICVGTTLCGEVVGTAQEQFTNQVYHNDFTNPNNLTEPPDTGWLPRFPSTAFSVSGSKLIDSQGGYLDNFATMPVGWTYITMIQNLRLVTSDRCGTNSATSLGSKNLTVTKVSATQYQLTVQ